MDKLSSRLRPCLSKAGGGLTGDTPKQGEPGRSDLRPGRALFALRLLTELHDAQGRLDDLKRRLRELAEEC